MFGPFQMWRNGRLITDFRSDKVRALLAYLMIERDRAVTRDELVDLLWSGYAAQSARSSLRVALSNLRQLLEGLDLLHVSRKTVQFAGSEGPVWCDAWAIEPVGDPRPFLEDLATLDSEPFQAWRHATMTALQAQRQSSQHNLPRALTPFVGRQPELEALQTLLKHPDHALVSLTGPGGIGKTRLALAVAQQTLPLWPGGAWFVTLEDTRLPAAENAALDALALTLGQALGIRFQGGEPAWEQLLHALSRQPVWQRGPWLMVLDNAEHLVSHVRRAVMMLLQRLPLMQMLVTSRLRLGLQAERVFPVAGLPVPAKSALNLEAYASSTLFIERVARSGRRLAMTEENLAAAGEICRRLEGVPLAIELAAALVAFQPVSTIASVLGRQIQEMETAVLDTLHTEYHDLPLRQRSMRAVLDYSWQLLSPKERAGLAMCAVFHGGWMEEAAAAVLRDHAVVLTRLTAHSLLQQQANGRYEMHPMVHAFAIEKLAKMPEKSAQVQKAHAAYYLQIPMENAKLASVIRGGAALMAWFAAEQSNALAAWRWASEQRAIAQLAACQPHFYEYFQWQGMYQAGIVLARETLAKIEHVDSVEADCLRARLHLMLARLSRTLGKLPETEENLAAAASLIDSLPESGEAKETRALLVFEQGKQAMGISGETAVALFKQNLEFNRQQNDVYEQGVVLNWIAYALIEKGQIDAAEAYLQEAWGLQEQLGDQQGMAGTMVNLALVHQRRGDHAQALDLGWRAVALRRTLGNIGAVAPGLRHLGDTYSRAEMWQQAIDTYQESAALARAHADYRVMYSAAFGLGRASYYLERFENAADYLQEAVSLIAVQSQSSITGMLAETHGYLALTHYALGNMEKAAASKSRCLDAVAKGDDVVKECWHERLRMITA